LYSTNTGYVGLEEWGWCKSEVVVASAVALAAIGIWLIFSLLLTQTLVVSRLATNLLCLGCYRLPHLW
jgi:hypothetical protein